MSCIPLSDAAARQTIDALGLWQEYARVKRQCGDYAGGMYWKKEGAYEYLVKTGRRGKQERIGGRSPENESVYAEFHKRKVALEARLGSLKTQLTEAKRLNKAVKAGRVPAIVIDILNAFDEAGIGDHFTVVGTHALYAYEAAAGVRIAQQALATQDVDLLWDARKRVRFIADMQQLGRSVLSVLQEVDPTFERKELQLETAINAKGFMVDFLRRMPVDADPQPFQFSDQDDELFAVPALRAQVLTEAPHFEHVVIGATGNMAMMRTIDPKVFVGFKWWLAKQPARDPLKRNRDATQAQIVQTLLDEGLLQSKIPQTPTGEKSRAD
jgi:hypothetical protein